MTVRWTSELWRILLVLVVSLAVGSYPGRVPEALAAGLAGLVVFYLFQLSRVLRWIDVSGGLGVPGGRGLWGDLYERIAQLQRRNRERELELAVLLDESRRSAEAMPDAVVALGASKEIRWFNEAASRLLKLRPKQDIGQPVRNLLRSPAFQGYLLAGDFGEGIEIRSPGDDRMLLALRIIPYGDGQYLLMAQDITQRHRLERVRKDFVANVSHELRTPLTVIGGFVENLQHDDSGCADKWWRPIKLMRQQTTRMQRIVEDLLLIATLEGADSIAGREEVDVREMLAEIVEETRAGVVPGEVPVISLNAEAATLRGNLMQLRSAFTNLVSNAAKYTPAGGRIQVRWFSDARGGVLEVEDTGEGIAPEHIPRLTERFYRVDAGRSREKGGTGLGLAIVKHVLQQHGARLEIDSEPGQGSCFRCLFPADRLAGQQNREVGPAGAG